jgi:hypothetical protein
VTLNKRGKPSSADSDGSDDDEFDDGDAEEDNGIEIIDDSYQYDSCIELLQDYQDIVSEVRKIVKLFKRSPTKNDDILQPYVKTQLGKEMSLILDCRTRWNSLADMLTRFLLLRGPVQKALVDQSQRTGLTDANFVTIQELVSC